MNSCWQVARTYLWRARFWFFGGLYATVATQAAYTSSLYPRDKFADSVAFVVCVVFACLVCCLAALHLRRLLSGETAHVVPRFAGPHLLIGGLFGLLAWAVVPWGIAWWGDISPLQVVGLHSLAGMLFALVLLWPRAIVLVALGPALAIWAAGFRQFGATFLRRFLAGDEPTASAVAILVALLAYPIAAAVFLRTRDRAATFSDELVVDRSHEVNSRWKGSLLRLRDATIESQLARADGLAWRWRRWQVPGAAHWIEWGLLVATVFLIAVVVGRAAGDPSAGLVISTIAGIIVLFFPLGSWRFRCTTLAGEFLRPVAREPFVRQFLGAMIMDFAGWVAVATLISVSGYVPMMMLHREFNVTPLWYHLLVLWALAVLLYGIALATIRQRYWLPWILGLLIAATVANIVLWVAIVQVYLVLSGGYLPPPAIFVCSLTTVAGQGLLLGWLTYRRWLRMDVT